MSEGQSFVYYRPVHKNRPQRGLAGHVATAVWRNEYIQRIGGRESPDSVCTDKRVETPVGSI